MSRDAVPGDLPRVGDDVWIGRHWVPIVVFHAFRSNELPDVEVTRRVWNANRYEEHTGVLPSWVFTRCGLETSRPTWEPGWSDQWTPPRFAVGSAYGDHLPWRLLNPATTRPCRRCYTVAA